MATPPGKVMAASGVEVANAGAVSGCASSWGAAARPRYFRIGCWFGRPKSQGSASSPSPAVPLPSTSWSSQVA